MTQRANLDGLSIYAFNASDDIWADWKTAYQESRLTLPCCRAQAVPREHPVSGTRFFSHGPYAAQTCLWKATGELHEDLVQAVSHMLTDMGWEVETDVWMEDISVDIVCRHELRDQPVAIQIETATASLRPQETILQENSRLTETDLQSILWLMPASRYGAFDHLIDALPYRRDDRANTFGDLAWIIRQYFLIRIEKRQDLADEMLFEHVRPPSGTFSAGTPTQPAVTGILADRDWYDGKGSAGSPHVRTERLKRLAEKWLQAKDAKAWLDGWNDELQNSPLGASFCSASAYIRAQELLRDAADRKDLQLPL